MRFLLFSFVLLASSSTFAELFNGKECLMSDFDVKLSRPLGIFGIFESKLDISKDKCEFSFFLEKYKVQKTRWSIDICRGPVHLKRGKEPVEVLKRISDCKGNSTSDYCFAINELILTVQDEGLVFAKGSREDLSTEHGQVYCAFLLMKKYLERGDVLNLSAEEVSLFKREIKTKVVKVAPVEKVTVTESEPVQVEAMPVEDELEGISLEKSPQPFTF